MTNKTIFKCDDCNREVDFSKYANCTCSECKKHFCSSLGNECIFNHFKKTKCKGHILEITNPQWICNLRNTINKDENDK